MTLSPGAARPTSDIAAGGQAVGPVRLRGRILDVRAWMFARDAHSIWYGQQWLQEVLRGSYCQQGCAVDDIVVLPFCRDDDGGLIDVAEDFRSMARAGVVDGPRYVMDSEDEQLLIQTVQFQLAIGVPHLFGPVTHMFADEALTTTLADAFTTEEWVGDGTFVIGMRNDGTVDATDIVVSGRLSLDGSCPVTGAASSVPPSWTYTVPVLHPGDVLTIDGRRGDVRYTDASCKLESPGLSILDFSGPFKPPDIGPCATMCVEASIGTGEVAYTLDGFVREL